MPDVPSTLALLGLLLMVRGYFALAEFATRIARKGNLQKLADAGDPRARAALATASAPAPFFASVRAGLTLATVLTGAVAGGPLVDALATLDNSTRGWRAVEWALVIAGLTVAAVLLGELVPRQLARRWPESLAVAFAGPIGGPARLLTPIVWGLEWLVDRALRPFVGALPAASIVTDEEVGFLMDRGVSAGVFHQQEKAMVAGVLRLDDLPVTAMMTPRPRIVFLNLDDPEEVNWRKIVASGRSHFPVYQANRDQVIGMVSVKAIWANSAFGFSTQLKNLMVPPMFVPETMTAIQLLERFKKTGRHLALVGDEFGTIQGMVTLIDVLEAVVGDLPERGRRDLPEAQSRPDGSWLIDATLPVADLKTLLHLAGLPAEEEAGFQTLGGFALTRFGRIPLAGDSFEHGGWRFEIASLDRQRIDKVLVTPAAAVAAERTAG
jgi:putative hemolysin